MTMEEYLAELDLGCPLCGINEARQAQQEGRTRSLQRQMTRLRERMEELQESAEDVNRLRSRLGDMCGTCQMLMSAISSLTDAAELRERIKRQIADLEEELPELKHAA